MVESIMHVQIGGARLCMMLGGWSTITDRAQTEMVTLVPCMSEQAMEGAAYH